MKAVQANEQRRGFWYTPTSRHVWRMYFAVRDLSERELTETEYRLKSAAEKVYNELGPDDKDIVRFYYMHNREPEAVAADLGLMDLTKVYKTLRRAEREVARNLGLLPPE